jgi:hypothetical protein
MDVAGRSDDNTHDWSARVAWYAPDVGHEGKKAAPSERERRVTPHTHSSTGPIAFPPHEKIKCIYNFPQQ